MSIVKDRVAAWESAVGSDQSGGVMKRRATAHHALVWTVMLSLAAASAAHAQTSAATSSSDQGVRPAAPETPQKLGSLYLQCDGNPNNMAAGESIARFVGVVTLLAVFAPSREVPDASKRRFGEAGVKACDEILSGEKAEGNVVRRLPLILARALHQIEAKDYAAAVSDVHLARDEAAKAGLTPNLYFDRSLGLSFDLIESQALLRMGKVDTARAMNVRPAKVSPYSYYPLRIVREIYMFSDTPVMPEEEAYLRALSKMVVTTPFVLAAVLDEAGRFAEAGDALCDALNFEHMNLKDSDEESAILGPVAANSYALAGNWGAAEALHAQSAKVISKMRTEGKPLKYETLIIERMDFFEIVKLFREGKAVEARKRFAARSRWTAPTFGQVLELNRLLRRDAAPEDLFGALSEAPEAMRARRRSEALAAILETDKNNRKLFSYILPYAPVDSYENVSGRVWKTKGNAIVAKNTLNSSKSYPMTAPYSDGIVSPDALLLHAALQAKSRGKSGFTFSIVPDQPYFGFVQFADREDLGISDLFYLNADAVIADLRAIIPSPDDLAARRAARRR